MNFHAFKQALDTVKKDLGEKRTEEVLNRLPATDGIELLKRIANGEPTTKVFGPYADNHTGG